MEKEKSPMHLGMHRGFSLFSKEVISLRTAADLPSCGSLSCGFRQ